MISTVPVLTGPNYQQWAPAMTSFLLSQGQWEVIVKAAPSPIAYVAATDDTPEEPGNEDKVEKWQKIAYKAVGNCHDFHLFTHFLLSSKCPNTRSNHDMALSYLILSYLFFSHFKVTPSRRGKQIVLEYR